MKMTEGHNFESAYNWVKEEVEEYEGMNLRTSVIAGFFGKNSDVVFTGEQVSRILALRYTE